MLCSTALALTHGRKPELTESLAMLRSLNHSMLSHQDAMWLAWVEARLLHRLDRPAERDEAIKAFESLASQPMEPSRGIGNSAAGDARSIHSARAEDQLEAAHTESAKAKWRQVAFPDGLTLSYAEARCVLTRDAAATESRGKPAPQSQPTAATSPATDEQAAPQVAAFTQPATGVHVDRTTATVGEVAEALGDAPEEVAADVAAKHEGAVGLPRVRWVFDTYGEPIVRLLVDEDRVYLLDMGGTMYGLDRPTGRVLWQVENVTAVQCDQVRCQVRHGNSTRITDTAARPPQPLCDDGRVFVPTTEGVTCLNGKDGTVLWRARMALASPEQAGVQNNHGGTAILVPHLLLHDGAVLAYDPLGDRLASFEASTGASSGSAIMKAMVRRSGAWAGVGLRMVGDGLLLDGIATRLVNPGDGAMRWVYEPRRRARVSTKAANPFASTDRHGSKYSRPICIRGGTSPQFAVDVAFSAAVRKISRDARTSVITLTPSVTQQQAPREYVPQSIAWTSNDQERDIRSLMGKSIAIAAGPIIWANGSDGHPRVILADKDKLWLMGQQYMIGLDPARPWLIQSMIGYSAPPGIGLGRIKPWTLAIQADSLMRINERDSVTQSASLTKIMGGRYPGWVHALLRDNRVFVAGGKGLMMIPLEGDAPTISATWPPRVVPSTNETIHSYQTSVAGMRISEGNERWPWIPMLAQFDRQTWFVPPVPTRLAAIDWPKKIVIHHRAENASNPGEAEGGERE